MPESLDPGKVMGMLITIVALTGLNLVTLLTLAYRFGVKLGTLTERVEGIDNKGCKWIQTPQGRNVHRHG